MDTRIFLEIKSTQGSEKAYTALVHAYSKSIYFHVRHQLFDHSLTDDLVQETFLKAWKGLDSFKGPGSIEGWLKMIATNEVRQYIRKKQSRIQLLSTESDDPDFQKQDPEAPGYWDSEQEEQRFLKAVEGLPEKQRLVFSLKYFEDLPYAQIVEQLGGTIGSLKASYHHATQKIKEELSSN